MQYYSAYYTLKYKFDHLLVVFSHIFNAIYGFDHCDEKHTKSTKLTDLEQTYFGFEKMFFNCQMVCEFQR